MKTANFNSVFTEFSSIFNCLMAVWTLIVRVLIRLSVSRLLCDRESASFLLLLPVKVSFSWKSILIFIVFGRKSSPGFCFTQWARIVAIIRPAKAHLSKD